MTEPQAVASFPEAKPRPADPTTVRSPQGLWHLYFFARAVQNYVDADLELFERYGDVVRTLLPEPMTFFFRPADVRHILRSNVRNYPKGSDYDMLRPILGDGIFVSEGDLWTRQRRLLAPDFREASVARFVPSIVESGERLFHEWDERARSGPIDVTEDMMRLTLWVVGRAMFKSDFQKDAEIIGRSLEVCLEHAVRRMLWVGLYKPWFPTRANREANRAERDLNEAVMRIIRRGRADSSGTQDVLSSMIRAKDPETGATMSDKQLLDETKSLVLAGHETTSLALSWGFYLLAQHPEVEARLAEEAERVLGDRAPTAADFPKLSYTRMVFLETMRLYPPVPGLSRKAIADDEIGGISVRVGDKVVIVPWVTHRHPSYWSAPSRFDPERFAPGRVDTIEPYSYFPFLLGRRACLGEHFAMLEGVLLLAMIARRYKLELVSQEPMATRPIATLRFARPLVMRITPRDRRTSTERRSAVKERGAPRRRRRARRRTKRRST